jgi:hypothetical protein
MTVEGASAALLAELLQEFEMEMRKQKVPVDRWLSPGASPQVVRERFAQLGLTAPAEAVVWFGWYDGVKPVAGSAGALPVFEGISLEVARRRYEGSRLGLGEWDWNPNWLQIMGGKYGLAVSCADAPEQPPLVRSVEDEWMTQDWQTEHQVVSLCTPVAWWIDAMRRGAYVFDRSINWWKRDIDVIPHHVRMYLMS